MYTIYHIPGVKVGCTKRDAKIRVREQGYSEFEILEVLEDITSASEREIYWQGELGYGKDSNASYLTTLHIQKAAYRPEAIAKKKATLRVSEKFKQATLINFAKGRTPEGGQFKKKPILQFDKQGNFIQQWPSAKDAGVALSISSSQITACVKQRIKTSGGFIWKYKVVN